VNTRTLSSSNLSVEEMHDAYRSGALDPSEVIEHCLARASETDGLNVFLTVDDSGARRAAEEATRQLHRHGLPTAPMFGIPVTVKDLLPTKGLRTTRGSRTTRDWIPDVDAPAVERIRAAGAIIIGKTNTSEGGWKGDSGNRLRSATVNPWASDRSAGGSSGGAAAAVALGIGPAAIGTDGAGSVRIPAAFCGVVGYKPSFGRVPYWPVSADNLAHVGVLARTVRDCAATVQVMTGPDPRDMFSQDQTADAARAEDSSVTGRVARPLRIGYTTTLGFAATETEIGERFGDAVLGLAELGHELVAINATLSDPYDILDTLWAGHEAASHPEDLDSIVDDLDPGYADLIRRGRMLSAAQLAGAHDRRHAFAAELRAYTGRCDLLLTPTVPLPAFPLGQDGPSTVAGHPVTGLSWTPFTYPFNLTGQPAITVPIGATSTGLPIGMQFVGGWRDDATMLAAAADYEQRCPWRPNWDSLPITSTTRPTSPTERQP